MKYVSKVNDVMWQISNEKPPEEPTVQGQDGNSSGLKKLYEDVMKQETALQVRSFEDFVQKDSDKTLACPFSRFFNLRLSKLPYQCHIMAPVSDQVDNSSAPPGDSGEG